MGLESVSWSPAGTGQCMASENIMANRNEAGNKVTVLAIQAAKHPCEQSRWRYSNPEMQKILYIAHMFLLGAEGSPIVSGNFEAREFGPLHPELCHVLKVLGARPVSKSCGLFDFYRTSKRAQRCYGSTMPQKRFALVRATPSRNHVSRAERMVESLQTGH